MNCVIENPDATVEELVDMASRYAHGTPFWLIRKMAMEDAA